MGSFRGCAIGLATLALALAGCGGDDGNGGAAGNSGEPLKIGAMNPYSGDFALYGTELLRGYQLAADEANAHGGVLGRQVELLRGDAIAADQAIAEAQRLATQENVDAFTGTYVSAVSQAASDVAAQQNKLYWETNALAGDLTDRKLPNFIRVGPNSDDFAQVSVDVMEPIAESLGKSVGELTVYIEHEDSIYGTSIARVQRRLLEEAGATVAAVGSHDAAATDLTDSVLRARSAKPDVWLVTGYVPDGNLLLRTARSQGFDPPARAMVGTGDTSETLEAIGEEGLEGVFVVSYPRADISEEYGPGSDDFLAAYKEKYGREPLAPQTMTAYSGMKVLFEVLEEAGSTEPEAVREAAAGMSQPANSLATGYGVEFDDTFQNTLAEPVVIQWQSGKQITVFPEQAAGSNQFVEGR
ncbi:MAG: ABC transporter substrate-binding protein [Solirubrobacteraceae bacterium]